MKVLPPTAAYRAMKVCASAGVGFTVLSDAAQDGYEGLAQLVLSDKLAEPFNNIRRSIGACLLLGHQFLFEMGFSIPSFP